MAAELNGHVMLGKAAKLCGVNAVWKVRRTIERGFYPEPPRLGPFRMVALTDLPKLKEALRAAGYLPDPMAAA